MFVQAEERPLVQRFDGKVLIVTIITITIITSIITIIVITIIVIITSIIILKICIFKATRKIPSSHIPFWTLSLSLQIYFKNVR